MRYFKMFMTCFWPQQKRVICIMEESHSKAIVEKFFREYDEDGNGTLGQSEVEILMHETCGSIDSAEFHQVFRKIDRNENK